MLGVLVLGFAGGTFVMSRRSESKTPSAQGVLDSSEAVRHELALLRAQTERLTLVRGVSTERSSDAPRDEKAAFVVDDEPRDEGGPVQPSAEQQRTRDALQTNVDVALRRGRWTQSDAAEFHRVMASLDAESQNDMLHQLAAAVNSGELRVDGDVRMPF